MAVPRERNHPDLCGISHELWLMRIPQDPEISVWPPTQRGLTEVMESTWRLGLGLPQQWVSVDTPRQTSSQGSKHSAAKTWWQDQAHPVPSAHWCLLVVVPSGGRGPVSNPETLGIRGFLMVITVMVVMTG